MDKYNIFSEFEKIKKLREIEEEKKRTKKPLYWILKRMSIPKSSYYDWKKAGGRNESRAPETVWNKTPDPVEKEIVSIRGDAGLFNSERSPLGISSLILKKGFSVSPSGVKGILKRNGLSRVFKDKKKLFLIYPKAERFMDTVCIDDIGLTNRKPRELSVFNAIDEYSGESVSILFVPRRVNRWDAIELMEMIRKKNGRLPKKVRLDNAKAHLSRAFKAYCFLNGIEMQFIDPGTPQQNWPVESFNKVLKRDVLSTGHWGGWTDFRGKQKILEEYIEYYNTKKRMDSDPLKRTPREISSGITSKETQEMLKIRLIRKHRGQAAARKYILEKMHRSARFDSLISVPDLSEMCVT
ncbi:MAG: integrase core domain-containing protein [Candidatus Paceibacterota bacterium]